MIVEREAPPYSLKKPRRKLWCRLTTQHFAGVNDFVLRSVLLFSAWASSKLTLCCCASYFSCLHKFNKRGVNFHTTVYRNPLPSLSLPICVITSKSLSGKEKTKIYCRGKRIRRVSSSLISNQSGRFTQCMDGIGWKRCYKFCLYWIWLIWMFFLHDLIVATSLLNGIFGNCCRRNCILGT